MSLVKSDVLGRMRTTKEQREALLDAFEEGGLSGPDFARVHGVNYQTFASWRQNRRRLRNDSPLATSAPKPKSQSLQSFTLIEASLDQGDDDEEPLVLELPGEIRLVIANPTQVTLAVAFINHWQANQ